MRLCLEEQVAPAPWLVARRQVDLPALIQRSQSQNPAGSADDVVAQLKKWGVQASGIIVSMWIVKSRAP